MPFDHFDLIAGLYNRTPKFSPSEPLLELLDLPSGGRLLDAGGGTGRVAEALRKMVLNAIVVDLSIGMLRYAEEKNLPSVRAEVEQLPFYSHSFDRIIMVDALHHVTDQDKTIKELWRVLAPGGKIVIIEPDLHRFTVKLLAIGEKFLFMRSHLLFSEKIASILEHLGSNVRVISNESDIWVCAERVR